MPSAVEKPVAGTPVDLVDPRYPPAVGGEAGWEHVRVAKANLDDDNAEESIIVTAKVPRIPAEESAHHGNQFIWDDGQPWQVYVEEPDGERTYIFARFVQLGDVKVRVTGELSEEGKVQQKSILEKPVLTAAFIPQKLKSSCPIAGQPPTVMGHGLKKSGPII